MLFAVTETKVRDKQAGRTGAVTFESGTTKGTSKIVLIGEEEIVNGYRVGEFYEMELTSAASPDA